MIIVTGGAGFIGSNLVRGLNLRGIEDILIVDDLEKEDRERGLAALSFSEVVDYRDFGRMLAGFEGKQIDALFHQGACTDTMEHDANFMLRVNTEYSRKLLDFALGRCPFLYASSAAVYGSGENGFREEPACEYPLNVYAFSKFLFDGHVRRVLPQAPTQIIGLRYFNVYGPQENHKGRMASVVHKFHHEIHEQGRLLVFAGSDGFRRDFIYVDDVVDVNLHFLDHPEVSGIFNCGTGRAESFLDLARCVASQYEGADVREIPFPEELEGKYQAFTEADVSRLRAAGYDKAFTPIATGVAEYVKLLKETGGYHRAAAKT